MRYLRRPLRTIVLGLLVFSGCPDAEPAASPDTTIPDVPADGAVDAVDDVADDEETTPPIVIPTDPGSVRFDLTGTAFTDFPFPSDLRLQPSGAPDLSAFPTEAGVELLALALGEVEPGPPGFGPLSSVYIGFHVDLDPATLPADATASLEPGASVFLIDITPDSPTYGQRAPVDVAFVGPGGGYWPARTLALHPLYGLPPRPATTYAAVVTSTVRAQDGTELTPPAVIGALPELIGATEDPLIANLASVHAALTAAGTPWESVVAAAVYTTADPMADLREFADWVRDVMPAPTISDLELSETQATFEVYEATWHTHELLSGTPPYTTFGEGKLSTDAANPVDLRVAISVPLGTPPAAGWPVILYSHGLGENYRGFVDVAAEPLAAHGVAVVGIDPPLQGARNTTSQNDRDLIITLAVSNIVAGREILRQGVLDNVALARLVTQADFGPGISFDPTNVGFAGHSEGAQIGALLLPLEPSIGAALLSEGGGGAAITLIELNLDGMDISTLVAVALGIDQEVEELDLGHPVVSTVIQPLLDSADPLHSASQIFREPLPGGVAHSLVMLEGFQDPLTPPPSMEALASAAGLPIAEPVGREIPGLEMQGVGAAPLPASGNLPNGVTGGLIQLPNVGHYAIYFNQPVRKQIFDYLGSSFGAGPPVLEPRP